MCYNDFIDCLHSLWSLLDRHYTKYQTHSEWHCFKGTNSIFKLKHTSVEQTSFLLSASLWTLKCTWLNQTCQQWDNFWWAYAISRKNGPFSCAHKPSKKKDPINMRWLHRQGFDFEHMSFSRCSAIGVYRCIYAFDIGKNWAKTFFAPCIIFQSKMNACWIQSISSIINNINERQNVQCQRVRKREWMCVEAAPQWLCQRWFVCSIMPPNTVSTVMFLDLNRRRLMSCSYARNHSTHTVVASLTSFAMCW